MIVMNPNQAPPCSCLSYSICKQLIDTPIGLPWTIVVDNPRLVVEDRPED